MNEMYLAQDSFQWRDLLKGAVNHRVAPSFVISTTVVYSRMILYHEIS